MNTDTKQASPYAPPKAPVEDIAAGTYEPRFFALDGRIGRVRFLAYSSLAVVMACGLLLAKLTVIDPRYPIYHNQSPFGIASAALYGILVAAPFVYARRRLHDIGVSGWQSLMLFVPMLGIWAFYYIACTSGTVEPNAYGPVPQRNGIFLILGAVLLPPLALAAIGVAIINLLAVY